MAFYLCLNFSKPLLLFGKHARKHAFIIQKGAFLFNSYNYNLTQISYLCKAQHLKFDGMSVVPLSWFLFGDLSHVETLFSSQIDGQAPFLSTFKGIKDTSNGLLMTKNATLGDA